MKHKLESRLPGEISITDMAESKEELKSLLMKARTGHGVQSTELGVQTADYIESTGGRPEGVSTGQEHSANVM